jgi:hypothetical protein
LIAELFTVDDNFEDIHTYRLVSGEGSVDNQLFEIDGNLLLVGAEIDYANRTSFSIRILSEDPYGLSVEQVFILTIE